MSIFPLVFQRRIDRIGMALVILLMASLMLPAQADAGVIQSVSAVPSQGGVILKIGVARGVEGVTSFALSGPERIVVDIAGATAGISAAPGVGGVAKVRVGQFSVGVSRLVIDLAQPMTLADVTSSGGGTELSLTLRPTDAQGFARFAKAPRRSHALDASAARPLPPAQPQSQPAAKPQSQPVAKPQPQAVAKPQPVSASPGKPVVTEPIVNAPPPMPDLPRGSVAARGRRPLVVIDAGHGGHDTGALSVWDGRREKDVTLAIAKAIKRELDDSGRVRTVLTRSDDRFLVLAERREVARRLKADLFISIHADSAGNPDAHGATVYTLSEVASDREAAKLAARENKSDIINGVDLGKEASDVSSILIDLARRDTMNVSSSFAALLQREMAPFVTFKSEFHRFAGFVVLKAPDTPSVLIETGYLSNIDDAKFLFSTAGQKALAKGVKNAVEAHFARRYRTR